MAALGKESSPSGLYSYVINEVIRNVRPTFLNRGVDEQVLQELKNLWELKVVQSRAVKDFLGDGHPSTSLNMYPHAGRGQLGVKQEIAHSNDLTRIPAVVQGRTANAFPGYPVGVAVNTGQSNQVKVNRRIAQRDGADEDDEEAVSSEESELEDGPASGKPEVVEDGNDNERLEDDPLNTDDDASEDDDSDSFESDNVIVCQYDKVSRARSKWKLHLKDGIMNIAGTDYVFNKATGDCDWS